MAQALATMPQRAADQIVCHVRAFMASTARSAGCGRWPSAASGLCRRPKTMQHNRLAVSPIDGDRDYGGTAPRT